MEKCFALRAFVFLYLSALTYNVPIKYKENLDISLDNATIHSAANAVVEFMIGNEAIRVCHIQLKGSCESVSDECVCNHTPNSDALVRIAYNRRNDYQFYRVITVDGDNERNVGHWKPFPDIHGCDPGKWGMGCLQTCDYRCHDNQCDHVDGHCTNGCRPGFQEPSCTKACERGTYGSNCTGICPSNCKDGLCDIVTGKCHQCQDGYTGDACDQACESGKYGKDCQHVCSNQCLNHLCHNMNGSCINCPAGKTGDQCDEVTSNDENTSKVVTKTDYWVAFLTVTIIAGIEFIVIVYLIIRPLKRSGREPTSENKQNHHALAEIPKKDDSEDLNKKSQNRLKELKSENDFNNLDETHGGRRTPLMGDMGAHFRADILDETDEGRRTEMTPLMGDMSTNIRADYEVHETQ